jgi:hypothetical protein
MAGAVMEGFALNRLQSQLVWAFIGCHAELAKHFVTPE